MTDLELKFSGSGEMMRTELLLNDTDCESYRPAGRYSFVRCSSAFVFVLVASPSTYTSSKSAVVDVVRFPLLPKALPLMADLLKS